jgi:tetratricopeptide (TPR) repeat protein
MTQGRKFTWLSIILVALALFAGAPTLLAQHAGTGEPMGGNQPNAPQPSDNVQAPQESGKEKKAFKTFKDTPDTDVDRKTQLGEDFINKFPQSLHRVEVVTFLATAYLTHGQVDKLQAEGDKEMALNPSNPVSLAVLGSNLSRAVTPSTPDMQKHLDQADTYCKKSQELLLTAKKPEGLSDEKFVAAKNQTSSVTYSCLGTTAFRRAKYQDALDDLKQAVKLSEQPDPVNYYLLGKANEATSHFADALDAYNKCAAIAGGMQAACKSEADGVKSHVPAS